PTRTARQFMRAARRPLDRSPQRPPPRSRAVGLARALFLALTVLVTVAPAFSGDRETEQRDADARQKLYVRRALGKDEALAPHLGDVWVEVRGTTVIFRGQLPSA